MPRSGRERKHTDTASRWRRFISALHSNQNFQYLYWLQVGLGICFDWSMRLLGPLLLLFATGLISLVVAVYFKFILPAAADVGSVSYLLHASLALFLAFNVFWNYYHCAFTHPGKPQDFMPVRFPSDNEEDVTSDEEGGATRSLVSDGPGISRVNLGGGSAEETGRTQGHGQRQDKGVGNSRVQELSQMRYCKACKEPKPARTHHCHVCDQCIVNMDHHCPWMNNCVGYLNYRYFVLFLLYMFLGCIYAVSITLPQFLVIARSPGRRRQDSSAAALHEANKKSAVMLTFVLSISVGIAISVLLFWHIYLIVSAQTTIEFYQNQSLRSRARHWGQVWINPYNIGWKNNWQQVFGPMNVLLGILPSRRPPPPPVVAFFPSEDRETLGQAFYDGEWTVDDPLDADHVV